MTDPKFIEELYQVILARRADADPDASYVARMASKGLPRIAQKVGEEGVETVIAALKGDRAELIGESADLIFHLLMLWAQCGVVPADVLGELEKRHRKASDS